MAKPRKTTNKRPPRIGSTKLETVSKKYLKVSTSESIERFKEIGLLVSQKKLKWLHFKNENGVGIHYYLILKKIR